MSKHTPYWFRVINNAIKRKAAGKEPFTNKHMEKSSSFVTCACGKQDPRIPRGTFGVPRDNVLSDLAIGFNDAVTLAKPKMALRVLLKIEKRAAEVLKEVNDGT